MLASIIIWVGLAISGMAFFILFVLPAIPVLWWRLVQGIANLIQAIVMLAIFLPLAAALCALVVFAAGMI